MREESTSLRSRVLKIQVSCMGEITKALILLENGVKRKPLQKYIGYHPSREVGSRVENKNVPSTMLHPKLINIVRC